MKVLGLISLFIVSVFMLSTDNPLYKSDQFSVYHDRIIQGEFEAKAISSTQIISNYKSPPGSGFSSTISFKFAINGQDNEAPSGQDHHLTIVPNKGTFTSPVIKFGEKDPDDFIRDDAPEFLPANTKVTIRVDVSGILDQLEKEGSFTSWSGEVIKKSEFDGVYIAGGSEPLTWDFNALSGSSSYKLSDTNNDGVYEGTFIFNPYDANEESDKIWNLKNDISAYPALESSFPLIDALYNMSLDETVMLKEDDGTFRTGAEWAGVWTRDISYSVLLSYAFLDPEISKASLLRKVKNKRIIQDTGSGGAWPVSTDRVVWSLAAMELYYVTGDESWLSDTFEIIKNTLNDDLKNHIYDERFGLFKGESSFLDWREQTYPLWMDNVDISQSLNLGTNAVYYRTLVILSEMAEELGEKADAIYYRELAVELKNKINTHFWNEEKGYYQQYVYGRHYLAASPKFEALGNALCMLFDIADVSKKERISSSAPEIPFGIPTIYPQIPDIPPYHNNGIWPFVQAYWNWSAKKAGNEKSLNKGLASLYRPAALFVTNKENMVAQNGDFSETQINSDRQLWSVAGNLSMIYRIFLGMDFQTDRILLSPVIPESYAGKWKVNTFKFRNSVLSIEVNGFGDGIKSMTINDTEVSDFEIPADLKGEHTIRVQMNNQFKSDSKINEVENSFAPESPALQLVESDLIWNPSTGADAFKIVWNGESIETTTSTTYSLNGKSPGFYQVKALSGDGKESFLSDPILYYAEKNFEKIEAEQQIGISHTYKIENYSGAGAIETSINKNNELKYPVFVDKAGKYLVTVRYSNGTGPWNTDNNCAIRTLKINGDVAGTLVLPQRGTDEWSNWGNSNSIPIDLKEGENMLEIIYEPHNQNMDGEINKALIDNITLLRLL